MILKLTQLPNIMSSTETELGRIYPTNISNLDWCKEQNQCLIPHIKENHYNRNVGTIRNGNTIILPIYKSVLRIEGEIVQSIGKLVNNAYVLKTTSYEVIITENGDATIRTELDHLKMNYYQN